MPRARKGISKLNITRFVQYSKSHKNDFLQDFADLQAKPSKSLSGVERGAKAGANFWNKGRANKAFLNKRETALFDYYLGKANTWHKILVAESLEPQYSDKNIIINAKKPYIFAFWNNCTNHSFGITISMASNNCLGISIDDNEFIQDTQFLFAGVNKLEDYAHFQPSNVKFMKFHFVFMGQDFYYTTTYSFRFTDATKLQEVANDMAIELTDYLQQICKTIYDYEIDDFDDNGLVEVGLSRNVKSKLELSRLNNENDSLESLYFKGDTK